MVGILIMSAKLAICGLLKIKPFQYKGYDSIISVQDATKRISSGDSNYIVNVAMWRNFGNSSITLREVVITLIS